MNSYRHAKPCQTRERGSASTPDIGMLDYLELS